MNILTDLKRFFFPRQCVVCGAPLSAEACVCLACDAALPLARTGSTPGNPVEQIFWGRFPLQRASSVYLYSKGSDVALILYAMKYHGRRKLCTQMGRRMAEELSDTGFFAGIDCLVPVPLHPSRLRQRGYNQSEELARGLSAKTSIPVVADALERTRNNATQTHKSGFGRWEDSDNLFRPTEAARRLKGKHILLTDDVLTTGATLTACADALSGIEDIQISVLTLAWSK